MLFHEVAEFLALLACAPLLLLSARVAIRMTPREATDRIASFLPTATTSAFQLILSAYPTPRQDDRYLVGWVYSDPPACPIVGRPLMGRRCAKLRLHTCAYA